MTPDIKLDADPANVTVRPGFFVGTQSTLRADERRGFDGFTYGYVLTIHKAQGSQWNGAMLFDEATAFRKHARRWHCTGIASVAERVIVVQP